MSGPHIVRPSRPYRFLLLWNYHYDFCHIGYIILLSDWKMSKSTKIAPTRSFLFYNHSSRKSESENFQVSWKLFFRLEWKSESEKSQVSRIFKTGVTPMSSLHWIECDDKLQYIIPPGIYSVSRLSHSENRYYEKMLLKQERLNETVRRRLNFVIKADPARQPVHCATGRTNSRGPNVLRPRVDILLICAMNIHH